MVLLVLGLILILLSSCTSTVASDQQSDHDGVLELEIPPIVGIPPGSDVTYCTYLDYRAEADFDIIEFVGEQGPYGHHTVLFAVNRAQPPGTHECTEADMLNVRYLGAGGFEASGQAVPEGIAFRLRANEQLMIQSHFINAGESPIDGTSRFTVYTEPPDDSRLPADLFTVVTTDIEIPMGQSGSATAECEVPQRMQLIMMGGHAHEWGTRVAISHTPAGQASEMLYDQEWNAEAIFSPEINVYSMEDALTLEAGDRLTVHCEYFNSTGEALTFPTEMCVTWAYYFPADRQIDCVDGKWPGRN